MSKISEIENSFFQFKQVQKYKCLFVSIRCSRTNDSLIQSLSSCDRSFYSMHVCSGQIFHPSFMWSLWAILRICQSGFLDGCILLFNPCFVGQSFFIHLRLSRLLWFLFISFPDRTVCSSININHSSVYWEVIDLMCSVEIVLSYCHHN